MVVSFCACRAMLHVPRSLAHAHAPCSMSSVSCSIVHVSVPWPFFTTYVSLVCPMLHAPLSRPMFHAPCFMLHAPRTIPHAPWFLRHVSCSTLHDLFFMFRALCFMPYASCSHPMFMLWPTDSALCSMPHASSHASSSIPLCSSLHTDERQE